MSSRTNQNGGKSLKEVETPPGIMRNASIPVPRTMERRPHIPNILPHEKVFPIQIGSELFRLSGASISSDAPSYFSAFFDCQLKTAEQKRKDGEESAGVRTLYIDRDPVTFADISRHLQGYHIQPRDGAHFVKLFADAQFYQLPRLIDQLFEEAIYISIGGREFRVPKNIFSSPGDSPNYFTLGFGFLFTTPNEVFPGLNRDGLLRPPSIMPPAIPNRNADIFADLLHILRGYPLHIRNEEHREELLRDCKYYLFKGVEQKLLRHQISHNSARKKDEIILRLEDLRQTGLSCVPDQAMVEGRASVAGWVNYARPYVDDKPYELIVEIGSEWTRINVQTMRAEFFGDGKTRISRLFEVVANKLNLPTTQPLGLLMAAGGASSQPPSPGNTPLSEDQVKIQFDNTHIILDGRPYQPNLSPLDYMDDFTVEEASRSPSVTSQGAHGPPRKRRRAYIPSENGDASVLWTIKTGQWRLKVQNAASYGMGRSAIECVLVAVKLDAFTGEMARNESRSFLSG